MPAARTYYDILGVPPTATAAEIKRAYRTLAKRHHPDTGGDAKQLAAVNEAADVLSDPLKRAAYDADQRLDGSSAKTERPAAARPKRSHTPEPEAPPPPRPTVALCEVCDAINRVKGDPRYYPANCGKCGRPLGRPATSAPREEATMDDLKGALPAEVRCPHCQKKNRVPAGLAGQPIHCLGCAKTFNPGEVAPEERLGDILGDLFADPIGGATDAMRKAEAKLKDVNAGLRKKTGEP